MPGVSDEPGVPLDLTAVENALRELALQHELPVIDAFYTDGLRVLVSARTPLEVLVGAAARTGAGFVTIEKVVFDPEDFLEDTRSDLSKLGLVLPDGVDTIVEGEQHGEGDPERLMLLWAAGGVVFSTVFVASWSIALQERITALAVEDTEPSGMEAIWARVAELAEQIEASAEFRRTPPMRRKAAGLALVGQFAKETDPQHFLARAVADASERASSNAQREYWAFEAKQSEMIAEFQATADWQSAYSQPQRNAAATRFMLERTGYAPSKAGAETFARLAAEGRS